MSESQSDFDKIEDAESLFMFNRQGTESLEETYNRLLRGAGSSEFFRELHAAYELLRDPVAPLEEADIRQSENDQPSSRLDETLSIIRTFEFRPGQRVSELNSSNKRPVEEDEEHRRKRLQRERQQHHRARLNAGELQEIREKNAAATAQSRRQQSEAEARQRREMDAAATAQRRSQQSEAEARQRREMDAAATAQRRSQQSEAEAQQRREMNAASTARSRELRLTSTRNELWQTIERVQSQNIESIVIEHYCGPMNIRCQYCGAYYFKDEVPHDKKFSKCCQKGQLINVQQSYPSFLENMLTNPNDPDYHNFRDHIRSYNSSVSFASLGAKIVTPPGTGPYVFKVQGQMYHLSSHTEPRVENERSYAQLYVLDSATQAVNTRMQHPAMVDCRPTVLRKIHDFFIRHNRIAQSYQLMKEVQERETSLALQRNLAVPVVHMALKCDRNSDERRYNLPMCNEVAMVFVNEDGEPPFNRDIRIYPRNPVDPNHALFRLNIRNCNLDPMVYAIMFPFGEPGWHPEFKCNNKHFTMLQYKSSLLAIRDEFRPILHAGKLSQQWVVDSYLQVEAHNLEYVRFNQRKLRSDLYQGLYEFVNSRAADAGVTTGQPVILPSTFEGSPRNMQQRLQDAMAIFAKHGPPDAFVTFTCNPNWREIQENLKFCETAAERFDLLCRVFKLKLNALKKDLMDNHVLGKRVAYVYTIEFQKRGLPHAHILIVFEECDKFRTTERIDEVVSAEIPDPVTCSRFYEAVVQHMLHGPCGDRCRGEDGECEKGFPKEFQENTVLNHEGKGYPSYRRRVGRIAYKNGHAFDNRSVVPHNKFLLLKYNAHINVEVCTSLKAVKYIYKYIYKGYDCANCVITNEDNGGVLQYDEISNFVNARYVSAPEAFWRLSSFKMHDRSHAVISLPVHLHRENIVYFEEGDEEQALQHASTSTKLTAWFTLNENDPSAHSIIYPDIPYHYVFKNHGWNRRQRGADSIIGRMHAVSPKDEERFSLRVLLLHVPGATSYADLRTVNGVEHRSFKEAAIQRGLLASDDEFDAFLSEASNFQMPYQLRQSFGYLCVFCTPQNAPALFDKYIDHMILDFERQQYPRDAAINLALHQIQTIFEDHNTTCSKFNLPTPTGTYIDTVNYDQTSERLKAQRLIPTLNQEQRNAFDKIIAGIDNTSSQKLFFLNGPGGSGKTYLYQTLISFIRGRGQIIKAYAFTGIAATLLQDGTTIHSGFGLPINMTESSTSKILANSNAGKELRNAAVLILDEISMLNKDGLRIIDKLLREEIMKNNLPFGGKVIVVGGDFRQTLPIVVRGNRVEIVSASITSNSLWGRFHQISLVSNMRSNGQNEHNKMLLDIGSGNTARIPGLSDNSVEIPSRMITQNDIVTEIFTNNVRNLSTDELSQRVILASTNEAALSINTRIIEQLDGELVKYTSADSIIDDDASTINLYPVEFVNAQSPSGVPPHILALKLGTIVMLIRNLNKRKGLCNGTRLIVRGLHEHFIRCEILSENHKGETVFVSRLDITPSDNTLPFKMKRRQFPLIPAFAITINKSQGQSYDIVGIFLHAPIFGHGQLYVALSRCKNSSKIKIFMVEGAKQGRLLNDNRYFTENIVYREIFR